MDIDEDGINCSELFRTFLIALIELRYQSASETFRDTLIESESKTTPVLMIIEVKERSRVKVESKAF